MLYEIRKEKVEAIRNKDKIAEALERKKKKEEEERRKQEEAEKFRLDKEIADREVSKPEREREREIKCI
jgi:hypothetical protein